MHLKENHSQRLLLSESVGSYKIVIRIVLFIPDCRTIWSYDTDRNSNNLGYTCSCITNMLSMWAPILMKLMLGCIPWCIPQYFYAISWKLHIGQKSLGSTTIIPAKWHGNNDWILGEPSEETGRLLVSHPKKQADYALQITLLQKYREPRYFEISTSCNDHSQKVFALANESQFHQSMC